MNKRAYIKKVIPGRPMLVEIETVDKETLVSITREQIVGTTWTSGWHGTLEVDDDNCYVFRADR